MKIYEATEQAYKNGYEAGYRDGKNRAMEDIAFHKFLVRTPEPSEKEIDYLLNTPPIIYKSKEEIIPIYPYSRWIPVTERLPERGQIVLVCGSRKGIYTAEFRMDGKYPYFHKLNSKTHWCVPTHWMPLPEPPVE